MTKLLKNKKVQQTILGLFIVCGVYVGFCFSTLAISHDNSFFSVLHLIICAVTGIAYLLFCEMISGQNHLRKQMTVCNSVLFVCSILYLIARVLQGEITKDLYGVFSTTLVVIVTAIVEYRFLCVYRNENEKTIWQTIRKGIYSKKYLIILCVISLVLMYDPNMAQFKWDGVLYYSVSHSISVFSISSMALYGHISQTVGAIIGFCTAVMGNNVAYGMILGNAISYMVSICAFYGILKSIVPQKKEIVYVIAAAIYAWSPFALGMANYYSLDFYCMCLFPVVLYYTIKKQWILQVISGMLFSFSKEPAIIVYGMVCLSVVVVDLCQSRQYKFPDRIKRLFQSSKYYAMVLVAFLWVVTICILGIWAGGNGGFALDMDYICRKLKVLYLLNFSWLFTIVIFLSVILIIAEKNYHWLFPLVFAQIGFTLFSCLFKTVNHARYVDISPVCLYLLACVILFHLFDRIRGRGQKLLLPLFAVLAGILLLSSYRTIDPVSRRIFKTFDIGGDVILSTGEVGLGDAIIYNKQALWVEKALSEALSEINLNEEIIIFPTVDHSTYYFDGIIELRILEDGEYQEFVEYWNPKTSSREPEISKESEECTPFQVIFVTDKESVANIIQSYPLGRYSYFYLAYEGEEIAEEIRKEYSVMEESVCEYRGWNVYRITFEYR